MKKVFRVLAVVLVGMNFTSCNGLDAIGDLVESGAITNDQALALFNALFS